MMLRVFLKNIARIKTFVIECWTNSVVLELTQTKCKKAHKPLVYLHDANIPINAKEDCQLVGLIKPQVASKMKDFTQDFVMMT